MGAVSLRDIEAVRAQLGRAPTTRFSVVVRCEPDGHPLVIRNAPRDAEGHPFPTTFWLTCPEAVRAVSRIESTGEIARLNALIESDPELARAVATAHGDYARDRARDDDAALHDGGVAGTRVGVKCLHAHLAHHLAGGVDPIGRDVAVAIGEVHPGVAATRERVAAIDQGTNSTRLLVRSRGRDGTSVDLARDMEITRLGAGVDATGALDDEAMERAAAAIGRFVRRAHALGASRMRVAATSAVRDARNRDAFVERLARADVAVAALEILDGDAEAALTFAGATADLDAPSPFMVLDIGGGSTEIVLGDADGVRAAVSLQMGSVRLTERCATADPPTARDLDAMRAEVARQLEEARRRVPVAVARTLVAVAGTTTTVQGIALDLDAYDPDRIHRTWLSLAEAERVLALLAGQTREERAAWPVMPRGREEVIVAGAVILFEAMRGLGFDRALVSERDILDGLAAGAADVR